MRSRCCVPTSGAADPVLCFFPFRRHPVANPLKAKKDHDSHDDGRAARNPPRKHDAALIASVEEFVMRLNGKQTIYQTPCSWPMKCGNAAGRPLQPLVQQELTATIC